MYYYFSNNKELFSPLEGNRIKCALPNTGSQEKRMVIRIVVDLLVHSIFKCAPLDATISQFIAELIERKVILAQKMASFTWNFRCNISLGNFGDHFFLNSYWASFPSKLILQSKVAEEKNIFVAVVINPHMKTRRQIPLLMSYPSLL